MYNETKLMWSFGLTSIGLILIGIGTFIFFQAGSVERTNNTLTPEEKELVLAETMIFLQTDVELWMSGTGYSSSNNRSNSGDKLFEAAYNAAYDKIGITAEVVEIQIPTNPKCYAIAGFGVVFLLGGILFFISSSDMYNSIKKWIKSKTTLNEEQKRLDVKKYKEYKTWLTRMENSMHILDDRLK